MRLGRLLRSLTHRCTNTQSAPSRRSPPERLTTSRHHATRPQFGVLVRHLALVDLLQSSRDALALVERRKDSTHVACRGLGSGGCCGSWGRGSGGRRRGRRGRTSGGRCGGGGGVGGGINALYREVSGARGRGIGVKIWEKGTDLGVPDETSGVMRENVLAQILEECDERTSPVDLPRVPVRAPSQLWGEEEERESRTSPCCP